MKIIILALIPGIFIFSINTSIAQTIRAVGGLNFSTLHLSEDAFDYNKTKPGIQLGIAAQIPIPEIDIISIESGMIFTMKGSRSEFSSFGFDVTNRTTLGYLEIPINAVAEYNVDDFQVYGMFGPAIGVGFYGRSVSKFNSTTERESIEWGSGEDYKRLDLGLVFGAGVQIDAYRVGLSYNLGIANTIDSEIRQTNRVFAITVGYDISDFVLP